MGGITAFTSRDRLFTPDPANRAAYDRGYAAFRDFYRRIEGAQS